ncbi:uncharacterized protein LOC127706574 [Mytilus californianus]|uniref:uncharacterized protein LOC127706574 n=1 Tax=Mytilus californianus TaxID=6549 RepID=UPI002245C6E8|nr:uncharacterized protein LOC127706574 [Mytilus californianus]
MDEFKEKNMCLQFYNYLCEKIGTEELFRLRQKYYLLFDFLLIGRHEIVLNSGSKSEGLELEGSDIDVMFLSRDITVFENEAHCRKKRPNVFIMNTQDIKPGFTILKLSKSSFIPNGSNTFRYSDIWEKDIVLSNVKVKQFLKSENKAFDFVHGPCITNKDYTRDYVFCFRCPTWIGQARKLRGKSRLWPCPSVVDNIERCGTLFVPIGSKTSVTEEFEWRISFSVAEKLLIYSFSHTQMLCYALLKIMLKEIIETYTNSKGILCSYFLKTVVFWVSEEYSGDKWQPHMIIPCFMACLARLVYCVDHSYLPHYFIPEINLLDDKLFSNKATELRHLLNEFYGIGPQFFTYSKTLSNRVERHLSSFNIINNFNTLYHLNKKYGIEMRSICYCERCSNNTFSKILKLSTKRHNPLNLNVYIFRICQIAGNSNEITGIDLSLNKVFYKIHKQRFPCIILGLNTDAASGWLYLATYLFTLQHFSVSLSIVDYALSKCTPDKLYCFNDHLHYEQLDYTGQQSLKYGCLDISSIYRRHNDRAILQTIPTTPHPSIHQPTPTNNIKTPFTWHARLVEIFEDRTF